jgi:hypothetical protein
MYKMKFEILNFGIDIVKFPSLLFNLKEWNNNKLEVQE